jgi:hypothetical protein
MAISWVSPGDPDAISAMPEGSQDEFGTHASRTWNPDDPDIGRVLKTADTSQISGPITAPMAKESRDLWLPIIHFELLL